MDLLSDLRRRTACRASAIAIATWLAGMGCRYFAPAVPEPPAGGSGFVADYTDPLRTLATMRQAVELRNQQGAYVDALADSLQPGDQPFNAMHDPADIADQPPGTFIPPNWGKDRERNFYTYVTQLPGNTSLFFSLTTIVGSPDSIGVDQYVLHRSYLLRTPADTLARGQADLRIVKVTGQQWRLLHWVDHRDPVAQPQHHTLGWHRLQSQS